MLQPGQAYSLPVRGEVLTGTRDKFLRGRAADEILGSGLSSGFADHAAVFYALMREKGAELLLIDAAHLTLDSLLTKSSGHVGVAVKDSGSGRWIFIDPASGRILSKNWDPASKSYNGPAGRCWVGYAGSWEDYPVKTADELKDFYETTLKAVPETVWAEELVRLEFSTSSSVNPNTAAFMKRYSSVYEKLGVRPGRSARVELLDGGPGASKDCRRTAADSWACPVGRDSGMTPSWFAWVERQVSRQIREPFQ